MFGRGSKGPLIDSGCVCVCVRVGGGGVEREK